MSFFAVENRYLTRGTRLMVHERRDHLSNFGSDGNDVDIGSVDIIEKLSAFKPFKAVSGNIDGPEIRQLVPENLRFNCEKLDVWITHIGGYPGRYSPLVKRELYTKSPDVFICGHSHILKVIYDEELKLLHLNPGAAGKQGWHKVRTLMRFCISEEKIHNFDLIELAK